MRYLSGSVDQFDLSWAAQQARDAVIPRCLVPSFAPARGGAGKSARAVAGCCAGLDYRRMRPVTGLRRLHDQSRQRDSWLSSATVALRASFAARAARRAGAVLRSEGAPK